MDTTELLQHWIADPEVRDILRVFGATVAATIAGIWAVYKSNPDFVKKLVYRVAVRPLSNLYRAFSRFLLWPLQFSTNCRVKKLFNEGERLAPVDKDGALLLFRRVTKIQPGNFGAWRKLGHIYRSLGQLPQAGRAYIVSMRLGKALKDELTVAKAYQHLAIMRRMQGRLDIAQKWLERAEAIYKHLGCKLGLADIASQRGVIERIRGSFHAADDRYAYAFFSYRELYKAEPENEAITYRIADTLSRKGTLARIQGRLSDSKALYRESLGYNQKIGRKFGIAEETGHLAMVHGLLGNCEMAVRLHLKALEIARQIGSWETMAKQNLNLALLACRQNRFEQAELYLNDCHMLNSEAGAREGIARVIAEQGNLKHILQDFDKAEVHIIKSLKLYKAIGARAETADKYCRLGNLYYSAFKKIAEAAEMYSAGVTKYQTTDDLHGLFEAQSSLEKLEAMAGG